ncbi:MAG: hypothetical protein AABX30_01840 [Nanoarchaeota archaeon]
MRILPNIIYNPPEMRLGEIIKEIMERNNLVSYSESDTENKERLDQLYEELTNREPSYLARGEERFS